METDFGAAIRLVHCERMVENKDRETILVLGVDSGVPDRFGRRHGVVRKSQKSGRRTATKKEIYQEGGREWGEDSRKGR